MEILGEECRILYVKAEELRMGREVQKKIKFKEFLRKFFIYLYLLLIASFTVSPFIFMLCVATFGGSEWGWAPSFPPKILPRPITLQHFRYVWTTYKFSKFFLNSAIVAGGITICNLFLDSLAGYAFAKLRFPGRDVIFALLLATMMIPGETLVVPLYFIILRLGWANTYWGLIVPGATGIFGIFLMRQFIMTLPSSLEDAAIIDGCSRWGVYWKIILPLIKPALATLAIITFIGAWNSFFWPLIVANQEKMFTLQVGLAAFREQREAEWSALMAGAVIAMLPTIVLFFSLQKYYVRGIILGAVKG